MAYIITWRLLLLLLEPTSVLAAEAAVFANDTCPMATDFLLEIGQLSLLVQDYCKSHAHC